MKNKDCFQLCFPSNIQELQIRALQTVVFGKSGAVEEMPCVCWFDWENQITKLNQRSYHADRIYYHFQSSSALSPAPLLRKPCILLIIDKKKPVYYIIYVLEEKGEGVVATLQIYIQKFVSLKLSWSTLLPKSCYCEGHACLGLVYDTVYSFKRYSEHVYNITVSTFLCLSHFFLEFLQPEKENLDVNKFSKRIILLRELLFFQESSKLWPLEVKSVKAWIFMRELKLGAAAILGRSKQIVLSVV